MDNLINEICQICKLPFNEIYKDYKVVQLSDKAIFVYNYIKIVGYSDEKISLKVKNNILEIVGKDLFISQINKKEIIIKGNILSFGVGIEYGK